MPDVGHLLGVFLQKLPFVPIFERQNYNGLMNYIMYLFQTSRAAGTGQNPPVRTQRQLKNVTEPWFF